MANLTNLQLNTRVTAQERCPYCHDTLTIERVEKVICEACGTPHHQACLAELGGCTVMGCSGGRSQPKGLSEEIRARVRERAARFAARNLSGPTSPEVVSLRMANQPWICSHCFGEFESRVCLCGEALVSECTVAGYHCESCTWTPRFRGPSSSFVADVLGNPRVLPVLLLLGGLVFAAYCVAVVLAL
ncbi:MAG: hypothetical protein JKY65_03900 [Planctomycetes bacterium]|nr:hypothetical protein [Planctomycetota bacterium]